MRQVPVYIVIGNGRMAQHFCHYLKLLNIPFVHWDRAQAISFLKEIVVLAERILLLISDRAIEAFIKKHSLLLKNKLLIHFSGRLTSEHAHSAHPLMTFGSTLYSLHQYQAIPFIIEQGGPDFSTLLPGLSNPFFAICAQQKAYYHSLCVMANNFSTILWQKFFDSMEEQFHIPKSALLPYLDQTFHNLVHHHQGALTGPLARGDQETIAANLYSLTNDPFLEIYKAFVNMKQLKIEEKI